MVMNDPLACRESTPGAILRIFEIQMPSQTDALWRDGTPHSRSSFPRSLSH